MSEKLNQIEINGFRCPATYHDAILKIRDGFQKGKVSLYVFGEYEAERDGKKIFCPIGYLMTAMQRRHLASMNLTQDEKCIDERGIVWETLGEKNLTSMLSMTREQAKRLQNVFDYLSFALFQDNGNYEEARTKFNLFLREELKEENRPNPMALEAENAL